MSKNKIRLGIDFGKTIASRNNFGFFIENEGSFKVINQFVEECECVYLISKVSPTELFHVVEWLWISCFFERTKLPVENVRFCKDRKGKGPIVKELGLTHMIDDRPEVMNYISKDVVKILFNPNQKDIKVWKQEKAICVKNWKEIEKILL